MINKILIIGSTGQLGKSFKKISSKYKNFDFLFVNRDILNLSNIQNIRDFFNENSHDLVINCAAFTNVDLAESESDMADQINNIAVYEIAKILKNNQCKFIHISTDYVFDGKKINPYLETDLTNPKSIYGTTKLKGEQKILETLLENALIIRTSWLYSEFGKNFLKTMLMLGNKDEQIKVISDQFGTPTYATDLAIAIMSIIENKKFQNDFESQIINYSNEGFCSWYDFAKAIFEIQKKSVKLSPIKTEQFSLAAERPKYSVLSKTKIKKLFNINIPHWKKSLEVFFNKEINTST